MIDFHCDTLYRLQHKNSTGDLWDNTCAVDIRRLIKIGAKAQFFAMFIPPIEAFEKDGIDCGSKEELLDQMIETANQSIRRVSHHVQYAQNLKEILESEKDGKFSVLLTVEDGGVFGNSHELIDASIDRGVSLLTLTHNLENEIGYPNSKDPEIMKKGLKPFGREVVTHLQDRGVIVDVSHLSDGGFYDVLKIAKKPVIASHSNARALSHHPRNLTDEMIRLLADRGGVSGLNYSGSFLSPNGRNVSRIEDMIRHLNHMVKVGGEEFVVMGSDLDGIGGDLEINDVEKTPLLIDALLKNGWTPRRIDRLLWGNALRVIGEAMN